MPLNEAIKDTLQSRFKALITDALSIPTEFPNLELSPTPSPTEEWARYQAFIDHARNLQFGSPGSNTQRFTGTIVVTFFTPKHSGDERDTQLFDAFFTAFNNVVVDGVHCRTPYPSAAPAEDWHASKAVCMFFADTLG